MRLPPGATVTGPLQSSDVPPGLGAQPPPAHGAHLTSRSRPAATVTMSPVSLLMVNMFWEGLCGLCVRMRYRTIPLAVALSSASLAVTVIT